MEGYLFGIPVCDLGLFATVLVSLAAGFASFFASTFLGIVTLMVLNTAGGQHIDYAISYRLIGLPVGLAVLVLASAYLGYLWVRRLVRHGR